MAGFATLSKLNPSITDNSWIGEQKDLLLKAFLVPVNHRDCSQCRARFFEDKAVKDLENKYHIHPGELKQKVC